MSTAISPSPAADDSAGRDQAAMTDFVLAGRAVSSGQFLAGLLAAAELETMGRPQKLPADLFPGVDPVVVQEVWDRALSVGFHAGRLYAAPRFHRDELERVRGQLAEAGFQAISGMVGRSLRLIDARPAEGDGVPEAAEG